MSYFDFPEKEIKIQKASEVVRKQPKRRGVTETYPFSKLEVGECFEIPEGGSVQAMRCLAYQRGLALGRKFKVSVEGYVERIA